MGLWDDREFWLRIKWHFVFIVIGVAGLAFGLFAKLLTMMSLATGFAQVLNLISIVLFLISGIIAAFAVLLLIYEMIFEVKDHTDKIAELSQLLKDQKDILTRINQDVQMSNIARSIAFRDADKKGLRQAVLEKLHQHNFAETDRIIKEIAATAEFSSLAEELTKEAEKYKNASVDERIGQVIAYIDNLMEQYQWVKATEQIEQLIKTNPQSDRAKNMMRILRERKDTRKKELLSEWDKAIKRQDTDKSLTILKELDLYLTPNEGLALQESARDAFRTKLHNLGVEFSMEVADKQWDRAVITGEKIIKDFPNSKMASEIRGKISVIRELSKKQLEPAKHKK